MNKIKENHVRINFFQPSKFITHVEVYMVLKHAN